MKKSYAIFLIVVLLLSGAALVVMRRPETPSASTATKVVPKAAQADTPKPAPLSHVADAPVNPAPPPPSPPPSVTPPESAEEHMRAQMRDQMARGFINAQLWLVEAKSKLTLSNSEHERLLDIVSDCRHAEAMVDAPLAQLVSFDGATLVMEIPPHPEQGAAVKTVFGQQLQKDFPDRAEEMLRALDPNLDRLFDGFGKFQQIYTVEKPREDGQVSVKMVAKVSDAQAASDPALADLARSISGGGWFSREILDMAHEAIVPSVDKYFPKATGHP